MPVSTTLLPDLAQACKPTDSWVCQKVYDTTKSEWWAGAAEWFVAKPLAILLIVLLAWVANRIVRTLIKRSMSRMLEPNSRKSVRWVRDKSPDMLLRTQANNLRTEARVQTLSTVFRGMATAGIWLIAILWILSILQVSLGPIVATAGVAGVALGFGAQYMIRDFLAGIFMVIEDQLGVGDIVDLGDAKGTVEKITLRSTRLRDVHGVVWHVPNGQIQRVANKSHEWARAVLDLEVGFDTDVAAAERLIQSTADALAADEHWMAQILETPEVWGVESFTEHGVTIRLVIKTKPSSQFGVMRELRARLKSAFEANGIALAGSGRSDVWVHPAPPDPSLEPEPAADARRRRRRWRSRGCGAGAGPQRRQPPPGPPPWRPRRDGLTDARRFRHPYGVRDATRRSSRPRIVDALRFRHRNGALSARRPAGQPSSPRRFSVGPASEPRRTQAGRFGQHRPRIGSPAIEQPDEPISSHASDRRARLGIRGRGQGHRSGVQVRGDL